MARWASRAAGSWLSGGGSHGRLTILAYHRVHDARDELRPDDPTVSEFDAKMAAIAAVFNVLPLAEAVASLMTGCLPPRALCVTFDDGYRDNYSLALPILRRHGLVATFFVASGYLDGGCMWNDIVIESVRQAQGEMLDLRFLGLTAYPIRDSTERRAAIAAIVGALKYVSPETRNTRARELAEAVGAKLPGDLMMTSAQLAALHSTGMEIGGHTVSHPILAKLEDGIARTEIAEGREALAGIVRAPVRLFAYPNGRPGKDYDSRHARMVCNLGFTAAVSTAPGSAESRTDRFQLPRFTPWDRPPWRYVARALNNYRRSAVKLA
jgi:peptidoglycan/xylan/chitin deacetylase (PgdA/CDA1 family)